MIFKIRFLIICTVLNVMAFAFYLLSCKEYLSSPELSEKSFQISDHILQGYFITSIGFDNKGATWLGTFRQGLIKYYQNNATFYNSKNSNLPDSIVVLDIAVDKKDNIWIGSGNGLIKFDNKEFTIFNTANSPLPENVVWSIAVDQDNILWLASCRFRQGGLVKYDGKNWTIYTPQNSLLPSNSVQDIVVDNENNKFISMSETINNGYIIKIYNDHWTLYDKDNLGFVPYYLKNLAINNFGDLFVSIDYSLSSTIDITRPNIIKYNGRFWSIINPIDEKGQSLGYVRKIATDLYGNLWASLWERNGHMLAAYNGEKWFYNDSEFPKESIFDIAVDKTNKKWIGTGNGVYLIGN